MAADRWVHDCITCRLTGISSGVWTLCSSPVRDYLYILSYLLVKLVTRPVSSFFMRDSMCICYNAYMPRQFPNSVYPSVTHVYCIKTAERIIEILSLSDKPIILVFRHQGLLRKSYDFTPNTGAEYKG